MQESVSVVFANCWFMKRAVMAFSMYCADATELRVALRGNGAAVLCRGAKRASSTEMEERDSIYGD